jgi:glycosyltransferase involved in cell wall biosynthesis
VPDVKRRLVILTEIIAPYRIPVFNALAEHPEVEPHVIFLSETDPSLRQWHVYKQEMRFPYEVSPFWRRRVGKYNLLLNRGVCAALSRIRPAAILCGGYSYLASWNAALWAKRHRVPLLLWSESTGRDMRAGHGAVEFLKARFLELCDGFVVPGKSSHQYLRSLGVPESSIFTAPNAVHIDFFAREAHNHDASEIRARLRLPNRFLLYVGRLVTEKGIFELVDAYAKLDAELRSAVGLLFVGDGPKKSELVRRMAEVNQGSIHCVGFVQREQLAEVYGLADALILPTHTDTWGLVVNEAMACALPVITTSVAGCVEDLVEDGWNGFVVPPRDVSGLCQAMSHLAQQVELRREMGARSAQRIRAYSPEAWADGVASAMRSVSVRGE